MQFKVSLLDKAISIPASYLALHRTPISSRQKWVCGKKCVRAGSESFTLQIKGDRLSLKMCIFPRCILLNLNDFRKSLFLDVFLHFVMLIARGVDRVWPDFKKCILFIKALHVHRLLILRGVWARQSECVFFLCYTVNTSVTFDWIWRKLQHEPLEHSTKRKLQREYIWPRLLIEGV